MIFTLASCFATYCLTTLDKQTYYKVDLTEVLKEKAQSLAKANYSEQKLKKEMIAFKEVLEEKLEALAKAKKGIIITTPVYGNVQDLTQEVLNSGL